MNFKLICRICAAYCEAKKFTPPGGPAVKLPQLTGPAIAQALLAVVPPLAA